MGRPKKPKDESRTAWIQIRCTPSWKEDAVETSKQGGHADTASMVETLVARERKRLKLPAARPR